MGVLDRFEKGVEKVVSSAFSRAFRSELKPVELASALRREVDDKAAAVDRDRTVVPNEFTFALAPDDFDRIEQWGAETLADELAANVTDHSSSQGYAFVGPVTVTFEVHDDVAAGRFDLTSRTVRGAVAPASASPSSRHPLVDIDGQRYLLTGPVTVIGRGSEADIVVDDPGVSRRHLEIRITSDGVVATDLGSTNGLFVEGHQVPAATLLDGNSLTIGRTRIMFWTGTSPADNQDR
ncbi:FhaA domain-containing protein [Sanguibacter sp. A247]|uniref:FhaA domain-containing protein n=1 Tax=unclassified Sanguibacter TaxID=2645534 RepID=UPI003FD78E7F